MRVGLIGDIHGNAEALHAVLGAAAACDVSRLLVTGDVVGYYDHAFEAMEMLRPWRATWIRGNHECMLNEVARDPRRIDHFESRYGRGLRLALQRLDASTVRWLSELPDSVTIELSGRKVCLCHGSPWNPGAYVYPDSPQETWDRFSALEVDIVVTGHTHHPMSRFCGNVLVINPGSVGQPRNRVPGAHWCTLDLDSLDVQHRVERYDHEGFAARVREANPALPQISEVLVRT